MKTLRCAVGAWCLLAATPAPAGDDALQALRAVTVAAPAAGLPFADVLQQAGDRERAALLRLGLVAAHVDTLNGRAWAPGTTLGQVIDGAVGQPAPVPDSALAAGWRQAFNRHVTLRRGITGAELPQELSYLTGRLLPAGPGQWTMNASGLTNYVAVVALVNRSPTPLPLPPWRLQLSPAGGLVLDCRPPALASVPAGTPGAVLADGGETVAPGAERAFVCRAVADSRWRDAFARSAETGFELWPPHFDSAERFVALASAIGSGGPIDRGAWAARFAAAPPAAATAGVVAAEPGGRGAPVARHGSRPAPVAQAERAPPVPAGSERASTLRTVLATAGAAAALLLGMRLVLARASGDPIGETAWRTLPLIALVMGLGWAIGSPWAQDLLSGWTAEANQRLRDGSTPLQTATRAAPSEWTLDRTFRRFLDRFGFFGIGALATLVVFAIGRGFVRRGAASSGVILASQFVLAAVGLGVVVLTWSAPSGEGWGRASPFIVAGLLLAACFWAGLGVMGLHKLHDLLDDDGLSWPGTVTRAFRRALDFGGTATRGEFWGFLLAFALAWMVARGFFRPLDVAVALAGVLPMLALAVRRFRALDARETWGLAALVGVLVLELLTRR